MRDLSATLMGVVRQEVKRSAGRSGDMGSSWLAEHAASWMQFLNTSQLTLGNTSEVELKTYDLG
jgi:hypothetical protein